MAIVPVLGQLTQQHDGIIQYHPGRYSDLRRALVNHHTAYYLSGNLCWPRRFTADQRALLPLIRAPEVLRRTVELVITSLYNRQSGLRRRDAMNRYTVPIGDGLFSHLRYLPNTVIATFKGEEISAEEGLRRTQAGRGRYMIKISEVLVYDCYPNFILRQCMASYANSPKGCYDTATKRAAKKNCKLRVGLMGNGTWRAQLVATSTIEADKEHLYDYADEYVFDV
ncbi:hypothetical protein B484DRAFT_217829 [Ochromonadaceae sp. CCMP2298]|nr:hypothetical protein B484DRAFT_217829 [Ochromonadaceae sp. CCMP2298]